MPLITEGNHRMRNTRSISLNRSQIFRRNNRLQFLEIKSLSLVKSQILQSNNGLQISKNKFQFPIDDEVMLKNDDGTSTVGSKSSGEEFWMGD